MLSSIDLAESGTWLNTPLRYYQGTRALPIQREIYGQTYEVGVRAKF